MVLKLCMFTSYCSMIMAANPAPSSAFNLRSILEKEKLSGTNFTNWYRNLRIVLKQEKKEYVIEQLYPEEPEGV